jgi:hypothetical protein
MVQGAASPEGWAGLPDGTRMSSGVVLARWILLCAVAEAVGIGAAALAAMASERWVGEIANGADVIVAVCFAATGGLVEGFALGVAQATGLAASLPRGRRSGWVLVTVLVAGVAWTYASLPGILAGDGGSLPGGALLLAGALGAGAVTGAVLGSAQAVVLVGCVTHPEVWILANVLGWMTAMPIIFAGSGIPTETWSAFDVLLAGAGTGLVAGGVLGLVTGLFLPHLGRPTERLTG